MLLLKLLTCLVLAFNSNHVFAACPVAVDAAKLLVKNICQAMTDNDLATMNGAICSSNATLEYSYLVDGINPCKITTSPYSMALPLVLRLNPKCVSIIPYFASVETINNIDVVTILAYSESVVNGVKAVQKNVLKFSSPINDCNIKLDHQSYIDARCYQTLT